MFGNSCALNQKLREGKLDLTDTSQKRYKHKQTA